MTEFHVVDRNPADIATPYPRLMDRPTSDAEWTERILAEIANPSLLGATPDTDPMAGEIARLRAVDPPARNLGDEMVLFAAGLASGGTLPIGIRAMGSGTAAIRGLTAEAEQALSTYARSTMNRLGRMPTADEVLAYLKLGRHVIEGVNHAIQHSAAAPQSTNQDQQPDWASPNVRWHVDAPGQAVMRPNHGPVRMDAASPGTDLDELFRWIVTETQEKLGEANDRWRSKPGRSFQSYTKDRIDSNRVYAGRTSGYNTPRENVSERDRREYPSEEYFEAELDKSSNRYSSIRGREQQLIDYYRSLNRSDNTDNGIWPGNPLRSYYMRNADAEFGPLLPRTRNSR